MGQSIKVSTAAPVEVLPFHNEVFAAIHKVAGKVTTLRAHLSNLLVGRYKAPTIVKDVKGDETSRSGGPTYDQYRADQRALAKLAADRKLADNQWYRKTYAAAVKELYGALPVSPNADAQRKAAAKTAAAAKNPPAAVGAPKGQTQEREATPQESEEAMVTRIGLFKTAFAVARIAEADASTEPFVLELRKVLRAMQDAHVKAHNPGATVTTVKPITARNKGGRTLKDLKDLKGAVTPMVSSEPVTASEPATV